MAQHRQQQDGAPAQEPPRPGNLEVKASGAAIFARTVTSVTALAEGYDFGSFSGVLVLLMEDVALSSTQVGVLLSSIFVGMIIGAPLGGALADTSGRKKALFLSYTGLIVGCLAMSLSSSFAELLVGRLVQGVGIGAGFSVVTTYITEVSPSDKRGLYVCLEELFVVVGVTCGYWFNFLLAGVPNDWRWMLGIGAAPACLAMLLLLSPRFLESPRWRMLQGQTQQATVDLVSLVGDREAHKMLEQWKERQQPDIAWSELICPQGKWRRRSTFAGIGVLAAQQLCGISMLSAYIASILSAELPPRQAFFLTGLLGCLRIATTLISITTLLDVVGRRPVMATSLGGMAISMAALTVLYVHEALLPWRLLFLACFFVFFSLGMGPVPYVYCGEVLPTELRSKGISLAIVIARVLGSAMLLIYPLARDRLHLYVVFAALALLNTGTLAVVLAMAPETMGEPLEEMHKLFRHSSDIPSPKHAA